MIHRFWLQLPVAVIQFHGGLIHQWWAVVLTHTQTHTHDGCAGGLYYERDENRVSVGVVFTPNHHLLNIRPPSHQYSINTAARGRAPLILGQCVCVYAVN